MTRPGSGAKRRAPEPGSPDRVLLVDPYLAREDPMERKFVEAYPSLGLLSLAGYLRARGADVEVVDLTFARDLRPLRSRLARFRPAIVGVHTKTLTKPRALAIASIARGSGAVTVAGGPDSASRTAAYLESGFDLVALGEGEATLEEIVARTRRGAPLEGTPGTAILRDRQVVRAPSRPFLRSLDELPMPAWDLLDLEGYLARWERRTGERRMAVLTSRGCPFDCSWCSKPTFGRTFRQRSADRVIEELRALKERYRVDYVRFCDDVFGIQRSWLEQLLGRLEEEALGLRFECLARVELLKPDLLDRMTRVGLARVYVGVESGSQKMLDLMNRGTRLAQIERTAESLRTHGVRQFWFLMLGYPGESLEDIEATLRLFRKFSPEEYSVSIAVPVPGTRFYEAVKDRLRSVRGRPAASGGRALLYEGAFPESLYHWEQARFEFAATLSRFKGKISPEVVEGLGRAADAVHDRLVTPILLGRAASARAPAS